MKLVHQTGYRGDKKRDESCSLSTKINSRSEAKIEKESETRISPMVKEGLIF